MHAGVVDVVLHIDHVPSRTQQADEGIAKNRVAQMTNVRGLVGINAGMLDQNLAADIGRAFARVARRAQDRIAGQRLGGNIALETRIDISRTRDLQPVEALGQRHLGGNLFSDLARRLAQTLGELK